jgi:clan AA aspartic protease
MRWRYNSIILFAKHIQEKIMGLTYADITLANAADVDGARSGRIPKESVRKVEVSALVDSGAYLLTIDESIKTQLGFYVQEMREVELADGTRMECEIVGPVDLYFKNRATTCRALVLPGATEVLLGAIPLEDLDVLIDPKSQQLIVHPSRPYVAGTKCK